MSPEVQQLREWIAQSDNIVFFGGAGVSTESGIPDFRSVDGLYNQKYPFPPETMLSHTFFETHPEEFYRFYHDKLVVRDVRPNAAHLRLAALEAEGKLRAVITQNIDGLHQAAGSREVLELHGTTHRCYCSRCRVSWPVEAVNDCAGVPRCTCGGVIRPDVVLYEEGLDTNLMDRAVSYIQAADMLIIGGTSLVVWPAAGLINYYRGDKLVVINRGATPRDSMANLIIREPIGRVFSQV